MWTPASDCHIILMPLSTRAGSEIKTLADRIYIHKEFYDISSQSASSENIFYLPVLDFIGFYGRNLNSSSLRIFHAMRSSNKVKSFLYSFQHFLELPFSRFKISVTHPYKNFVSKILRSSISGRCRVQD